MKDKLPERRRFVRTYEPIKALVDKKGDRFEVTTNNLSPMGLNFETQEKLDISTELDIVLYLPPELKAVALKGRVVWCRKASLEDFAPHTSGVEILKVRDEDKNIFLKYMCDMMYNLETSIKT